MSYPIFNVGFTGTRNEPSSAQKIALEDVMRRIDRTKSDHVIWAHDGDCQGADSVFHLLARNVLEWWNHGHIPIKDEVRAFNQFDKENVPTNYLARDRTIVHAADVMIACPRTMNEEQRGGTWYTINYAREQGKPICIVWPDGTITLERWDLW